jgi:hypothetical protein
VQFVLLANRIAFLPQRAARQCFPLSQLSANPAILCRLFRPRYKTSDQSRSFLKALLPLLLLLLPLPLLLLLLLRLLLLLPLPLSLNFRLTGRVPTFLRVVFVCRAKMKSSKS